MGQYPPTRQRDIHGYTPGQAQSRSAMPRATLLRQRLFTLFLAGLLALFSPLILRFEGVRTWLGIPGLYLFLFGVWAAVIAAAAWIVSRGRN